MKTDLSAWSDERLAGQRLMAGFEGTAFNAALERLIAGVNLGGLILFKRNLLFPEQIARLCRSAQECARACGLPPLLIAIDQEGGPVARLGRPFTRFAGNPAMEEEADAQRFAAITAAELSAVGITMNLAPVVDVVPEGFPGVMAGRVFAGGPERVARMGRVVIEGLQARGIMAVAKHFPGIGRTRLDSHVERPVLPADLASLAAFDLIPFQAAVDGEAAGIMLAHVLYPLLDPQWPASLSRTIVRGLLRRRMGYPGIVMTDDLEMGAIERCGGLDWALGGLLAAEVDMALVCHTREKIERAADFMARASAASQKGRQAAERSVGRILAVKQRYWLREKTSASSPQRKPAARR
ncbi:MAG: beta-N-acetylhexosaminidase [Desulfobacterales bacterium]|jgi:beta-N-acetylhexosaminidase|nr:beta-N-acetylhexosaminidase [Desulfobacterales bacterium]